MRSDEQDRLAIQELIYRYCRSMDRVDIPLGHTVFHADSHADYGDFYRGSGRGFVDYALGMAGDATLRSQHQVANIIIDLDGDRAGSEAYVTATMNIAHADRVIQSQQWGRYIDQWSYRDGRWGIDRRVVVTDFEERREAASSAAPEEARRDRTDPSYAVLRDPE